MDQVLLKRSKSKCQWERCSAAGYAEGDKNEDGDEDGGGNIRCGMKCGNIYNGMKPMI